MNVLVLHSELGVLRGGGENFTRNLFTAFASRGHRVTAAFVADPKGRYPIVLPSSINPIPIRGRWLRNLGEAMLSTTGRRIPLNSRIRRHWDRFHQAISWRAISWHNDRFRRRVARELAHLWSDFDTVYVHGDAMLATEAARYRPTLLRLPGPVSAELSPLLQRVHAVCANGDALIQIARFLGEGAIELPVGLDKQIFKPGLDSVRHRLGWSDSHLVLGYVGRLTHLKGVDLLTEAFLQLLQEKPEARLLIVGQGEADRAMRSALANQLESGIAHIESDVDHEKLPEWYRTMNLFVMPSRYENYSNALLESMACGIPFLASDRGGNKLLAESGSGWLFQGDSLSSLLSQLSSILDNRTEMIMRGAIGSQYVRGRFSWTISADRLEQIIISRLGVK